MGLFRLSVDYRKPQLNDESQIRRHSRHAKRTHFLKHPLVGLDLVLVSSSFASPV